MNDLANPDFDGHCNAVTQRLSDTIFKKAPRSIAASILQDVPPDTLSEFMLLNFEEIQKETSENGAISIQIPEEMKPIMQNRLNVIARENRNALYIGQGAGFAGAGGIVAGIFTQSPLLATASALGLLGINIVWYKRDKDATNRLVGQAEQKLADAEGNRFFSDEDYDRLAQRYLDVLEPMFRDVYREQIATAQRR